LKNKGGERGVATDGMIEHDSNRANIKMMQDTIMGLA